ncbi:MAG: hypothetical protein ACRYGG_23890 [Janthinobacterium lividum]
MLPDEALRITWNEMRMVGEFDHALRSASVRRVIEAVTSARKNPIEPGTVAGDGAGHRQVPDSSQSHYEEN